MKFAYLRQSKHFSFIKEKEKFFLFSFKKTDEKEQNKRD